MVFSEVQREAGVSAPKAAMTRTRWYIIWLAFAGLAINYLDRASLSVALPFMADDFTLTATQEGFVFAAFFWSYDVCQLAAGWYVDKVGPRKSFTLAALWWSAFTMLTSSVRGFGSLIGVRALLGIGESPANVTSAKVVATWFPTRERGLATSIWDSGSRVGAVVSLPIVTGIVAVFHWRAVFIIIGLVGIVWAFVWWKYYRSPQEHPSTNEAERRYILDGGARSSQTDDEAATRIRWISLFRYRKVLVMMFGFFCLNSCIYFFITFFPSYLVQERGFSLMKLGWFGAIPGITAVLTAWLAGRLADRAIGRGVGVSVVRKTCIVGGLFGGSVIMFATFVPEAWMALALLAVSYSSLAIAGMGIWSLPADIAPSSHHVGSIGGMQNFASNLAGIFTPIMVGVLVDRTGSFRAPLAVIGVVAVIGALNYLFLLGKVEPLTINAASTTARDSA
ncbi:MFS transporter [Pengzhenrongella sp.]|jgi:ACS family glucarate transporter-like MFS transporter|uniref:MFS transporter n=1 Tax=Pengzhenrongella sp. TaxID=2888820 RepID=UPI002F955818